MNPTHAGSHRPVMLDEVMQGLAIHSSGCYVDGTYGGGGHTRALLAALGGPEAYAAADPLALTIGLPEMNRRLAGVPAVLMTSDAAAEHALLGPREGRDGREQHQRRDEKMAHGGRR